MLGYSLVSTDGKVLGYIIGKVDGIKLRLDCVIELGSLDGSLDGSNYGKLEILLLGSSLGSTDGKVPGYE